MGPMSLFNRVKFIMSKRNKININKPHFKARVKERCIPSVVLEMIEHFDSSKWDLISVEVRSDTGKFISSSWGRACNGCYYIVILGLGDIAETIYATKYFLTKLAPRSNSQFEQYNSSFYSFVQDVNQRLMVDSLAD